MRLFLKAVFAGFALSLIALTVRASLDQGVVGAFEALWPDAWFRATLADAYIGFLTIYSWVFYKESSPAARVLWLGLFLALGNIAVSSYVLLQLFRLRDSEPLETLLLRRAG